MAIAQVVDGEIIQSSSAESLAHTSAKKHNGSTVDKDQFLQLLVAQMKYQDPLEPTSNTEYISQYATFSELEQMQNMSASLELARASQLVGQTVLMSIVDSAGRETLVQGNVDYVVYENGKAYLSINGELYSMDDLNTVADPTYLDAYKLAAGFINDYNKLPKPALLTIEDKEAVYKLRDTYENMTDYQKKFISDDYVSGLQKLVDKMKELELAAEQANQNQNIGDSDDDSDTDDTDVVE